MKIICDSPDFLDTGDPDLDFGMLRECGIGL